MSRPKYYMTHIDNLASILENGIFSHNKMATIPHTRIDNQTVNARRERIDPKYNRSLHDYVPLYFNPRNPMLYAVQKYPVIILEIDSELVPNLITDGNAASKATNFYRSEEEMPQKAWNDVFERSWTTINICISDLRSMSLDERITKRKSEDIRNSDLKRSMCAEALVLDKIEPQYIKAIYCRDSDIALKVVQIRDACGFSEETMPIRLPAKDSKLFFL